MLAAFHLAIRHRSGTICMLATCGEIPYLMEVIIIYY